MTKKQILDVIGKEKICDADQYLGSYNDQYLVKVKVDYNKKDRRYDLPSWLPNHEWLFVTDSYPEDRSGILALYYKPIYETGTAFIPLNREVVDILPAEEAKKLHPELFI
jgi:hypothetical protein